jgi:PelA/Pel-15E family pectate lyase
VIHSKGDGYIAAPMRFAPDEAAGLIFINSKLTAENTQKGVYLGRPWRDYGRTVFLDTEMGAHIKAEGWHHWQPEREKTAYFAEYNSRGEGAKSDARVKWARRLSKEEAVNFAAENFLKGADGWNPKKLDFEWQQRTKPDYRLVSWNDVLEQKPLWYAVDEATRIANQVLLYQRENGGWDKNVDMAAMLTQAEREKLLREKSSTETTIDNGATTTQLRYLAKVVTAKNIEAHKTAFLKGLDFLLGMQYENGGFPQYFPLRKNYSREITFNDNAMINALRILRDVAKKKEDYLFVDEERRLKAEKAVERAIPLILKTQVEVGGKKTVWAAQYDEVTLKPANARKFEPAALTASESVGVVRFLMLDATPDEATIEAIEAAVEWYRVNKIEGIRWERKKGASAVVKDKNAPPIWARFYQMETMKPIFIGRDAVIKYDVMEIDAERRDGYAWYVSEPNELLEKDYPKWKEKIKKK